MSPDSVRLPPPKHGAVDLLIIAGEHSGDEHAARMVAEARERQPGLVVAALGGPRLAAAGAQLLHDLTASSVVGVVEVLRNYGYFKALFDETQHWITMHTPRAVCFVDYPGFNLRMAAALHASGLTGAGGRVRALYYISPQIWAWKPKRRYVMARDLDALAVIFPFEVECYADTNLAVEFVGHPFVAPDFAPPVRHDPAGPVLLLPGSRVQPVRRIFPALLDGFAACPEAVRRRAVVLYPSDRIGGVLQTLLASRPQAVREAVELRRIAGADAGRAPAVGAAAVLTSSGTMSMHCALAGIPGAIAYRANPITYLIGRQLVGVKWLGIANILLGEAMYPEFVQGAATPGALAAELNDALASPARAQRAAEQASRLRVMLAQPSAGSADWLLRQLKAES